MTFQDFWYVVALSSQLKAEEVLSRTVLDEWIALFRDEKGNPIALRDCCLHRNSRLSAGSVKNGQIQCPYHGWRYNRNGEAFVPAEGPQTKSKKTQCKVNRLAHRYETKEQDGYVYIRLAPSDTEPFSMPYYRSPGWSTVRVINHFENSVTNCAENFIDTPHTASVHPGIFRSPKQQKLQMKVTRTSGQVSATYHQETTNLGWYRWFLNPSGQEIRHVDRFFMPNITSVEYDMGPARRCFITSQSVPQTETSTLVYTDVTFNYGIWNWLARPFVRWTAQRIIHQDQVALKLQQQTIDKYGERFTHTPVDTIHVFVESIRSAIAQGKDPRQLPNKSADITFWI